MPAQVLIWPSPWENHLKNGIFGEGFSLRGSFKRAYSLWRDSARLAGYELNTWDMLPLESADVLWFTNLPRRKSEFDRARQLAPGAKTVLQIIESPVLSPAMFYPENQRRFDCIVTYDTTRSDNRRTFGYHLPTTVEPPKRNPPFEARRVLCMVNSNLMEGWMGMRQKGWEGLPGIGPFFSGWHVKPSDVARPLRGQLYGARRDLCRAAEAFAPPLMDIFGKGWNGEQISWCPLYRNRPYQCFRKKFVEDKIAVLSDYRFNLAFENYRGSHGYIDIKIFDGFLSGSVPVYLGEERIAEFVPPAAFVDARNFASHRELLLYLKSCPEPEWRAMREAGQNFLKSEAARPFSDEAFAERMVEVLKKVINCG
jgi:hypothetical protein